MNKKMIQKIVRASGVTAGELVLIHFWGEDADKSIANYFMEAVAAAGATPMLLQQARTINRDIFLAADDNCFDQRYFDMLSNFDAVLDLFTYQPVILGFDIAQEPFNLYRKYASQLFSTLLKCKRFTQIRIPTKANAEESGLEAEDYISRMRRAYDVDYALVEAACKAKADELASAKQLVLRTGANCQLHLDLDGRAWNIDAGNGDLPCGEIYIAPVEGATHGNVFFEKLFIEDLGVFENTTLSVAGGQVSCIENDRIQQFLSGLPAQGNVVCEFGLGMNPNVTDLCGYTLLDEKMAGTFHIAIGANTMFGGQNDAPMHIDFVGIGRIDF